MAGIGERQHPGTNARGPKHRYNVFERHVVVVRAFGIAPADVQPHVLGRDVADGAVDRRDRPLREIEKIRQRAITIGARPSMPRSGKSI